jgi:hypothetical protein
MTSDPDLDPHGKYMQRGIAGKNTRQGNNGTNFDKDDAGRVYWLASPYSGNSSYFCSVNSSGAAHGSGGGLLPHRPVPRRRSAMSATPVLPTTTTLGVWEAAPPIPRAALRGGF